ncbi:HAMP domain-containing histidine kinase [Leptolyngbya sp. FACHB-402]|jgi:signal transduction histidine kinase|nr:HAMP domain-containing histidine kinase [Leptolyngbya sp. FACHB-161]MBD2377676.1 HAMP domain-containing histidine kinase [Leptolyngbya sp. FACHB-238]MBD2402128.1 HAMP domain-containing histidine kinase [Leptolyngbya sp. FACHB-239]MBD2408648.1 HAMP domain-containing histidine kinase [Leptolyngbya sp. FACHB-402]
MNPLGQGSNRWSRRRKWLDFASLQVRLMVVVIVICAIALASYKLFSHWSIQTVLMMHSEQLTIAQFLTITEQLATLSLLVISAMAATILGGIWLLLRPLKQFQYWVQTTTTVAQLTTFNARAAPSEIRTLAQAWDELLSQRAAVKQQQRQFISDVAHELRSPLSTVYGYLQRTVRRIPNLSVSQQESLEMATSEAERMTLILQDLISLARAESFDSTLAQEPLILNEFVRDISSMTEKFDHPNIQTEIAPMPIRVQTHRDYLMQVLDHLIQNAVRYSDPNSPVLIRLKQVDNFAVIQVIDRGEGIPPSDQVMIFEPFHRIDPSRSRATGGTGLGLAIVKTLIEKMGGTLSLDSEPGVGTTFTLTLPILGR